MAHTKTGTHRKIRRLTPAERWALVFGAWAIAAESPVRGALLIADGIRATAEDVAEQATVSVPVARSALGKAGDLGLLYEDTELQCLVVHDFAEWNPEPKADATGAERQRRFRERHRNGEVTPVARDATRNANAPEVKKKGSNTPPSPPSEGGRQRSRDRWEKEMDSWARQNFPDHAPAVIRDHVGWIRLARREPTVEEIAARLARSETVRP